MRTALVALSALALSACATDDDAGTAVVPQIGDGKADALDRIDDQGAITFDEVRIGAFTEDLQFFGYRLAVGDGASVRVEITQLGTARNLDTTLFVFGPHQGGASGSGAFGTDAIAFDDDSGWGRQSRLTGLELDGGEYLVVVGTHDARGRGRFRLAATCEGGDCSPSVAPQACDPGVADDVLACVAIQVADAEADPEAPALSHADALDICTDGEALGPIFDEQCSAPQPPAFCSAGFEVFATQMGPACREELTP